LLDLSDVVAIAAGERHSLALTDSGDLYAWGENGDGQLGTGNTTDSNVPVLILSGVSSIGAGYRHSLAVKTDATAWAWGKNAGGQLDTGHCEHCSPRNGQIQQARPRDEEDTEIDDGTTGFAK